MKRRVVVVGLLALLVLLGSTGMASASATNTAEVRTVDAGGSDGDPCNATVETRCTDDGDYCHVYTDLDDSCTVDL